MKNIMVLTGHGKYATGIKSTLEFLAGYNNEIEYLDFTSDDTDITLKGNMQTIIDKNKGSGILFVCDILGGTPFKCAVELSLLNIGIEVVAGCNIGSMLDSSFKLDSTNISELADLIVGSSIKSTIKFKINIAQSNEKDLQSDLGI